MVSLTAIAAVSQNGVISSDGEIPWDIPEDKEHYRKTIQGSPVVMGRNTFDGSGAKTDCLNVVLSRNPPPHSPANVRFVESVEQAITCFDEVGVEHAYNVGGGAIYNAFLPHMNKLLISEIAAHYEGDVFFPYIDATEWEEKTRMPYEEFDIVLYERAQQTVRVS